MEALRSMFVLAVIAYMYFRVVFVLLLVNGGVVCWPHSLFQIRLFDEMMLEWRLSLCLSTVSYADRPLKIDEAAWANIINVLASCLYIVSSGDCVCTRAVCLVLAPTAALCYSFDQMNARIRLYILVRCGCGCWCVVGVVKVTHNWCCCWAVVAVVALVTAHLVCSRACVSVCPCVRV
jgi:hypothetical protein